MYVQGCVQARTHPSTYTPELLLKIATPALPAHSLQCCILQQPPSPHVDECSRAAQGQTSEQHCRDDVGAPRPCRARPPVPQPIAAPVVDQPLGLPRGHVVGTCSSRRRQWQQQWCVERVGMFRKLQCALVRWPGGCWNRQRACTQCGRVGWTVGHMQAQQAEVAQRTNTGA